MAKEKKYDSNLAMGLGLINETRTLLEIWRPPMNSAELYEEALDLGILSNVTAARLRNIVIRCFAPRLLQNNGAPACHVKTLLGVLPKTEIHQLLFLYTCRANIILADFVRDVYWLKYMSAQTIVTKQDAEEFISRAIDDGKTPSRWADGQIARVGRYLLGCCADYGLLGKATPRGRSILNFRLETNLAAYLAHDLHFNGVSDNAIMSHPDWALFGLTKEDVRDELTRQTLRGNLILQSAGSVTHIGWRHKSMEGFVNALAKN